MTINPKRQRMRARQRKQKITSSLIWGGVGAIALVVIGMVAWQGTRPAAGEPVPVMASPHIAAGTDPGTYSSNPPTSGPHYEGEADPGFYDSNDFVYPAGYLVHNLEHGYVILWYNCDLLDEPACADLKTQIKTVMDDLGGRKLIAYPWPSLEVPFVMTSWGRIERFEAFDAGRAKAFVRANLNHAPEPNAP